MSNCRLDSIAAWYDDRIQLVIRLTAECIRLLGSTAVSRFCRRPVMENNQPLFVWNISCPSPGRFEQWVIFWPQLIVPSR